MKILVTAFEPFGKEVINPSYEVLKNIDDRISDVEIFKVKIPTVFHLSIKNAIEKIEEIKPDAVLSLGQAAKKYSINVERIAINIDDARIPDTAGQKPVDTPIDPQGSVAYFATIPIKKIVEEIKKEKIPAVISNTAGTYVCNHLMYGILNYIHKNNLPIKAGFIHVPYLAEQVLDKPETAFMSLEDMIKAIKIALRVIAGDISGST